MWSLWDKLTSELEPDERIVFPEMYLKNRHMYDQIRGIAYIIKERDKPNGDIDWVWEGGIGRVIKDYDVEILAKQIIVRLRLPWSELKNEWLVGQQELDENRELYQVLEVCLKVIDKNDPYKKVVIINPLEFEMNPDGYEIVEARYLVCLKSTPEEEARFLGIDPKYIHTVISQ